MAASLALLACALPASAQAPAPAQVSAAAPIGRLLLTPAERGAVERVRANIRAGIEEPLPYVVDVPEPGKKPASAPVTAAAPQVVNGWVIRSGQRSTVWVNGEPYYRFDQPGETRQALAERGLVASGRQGAGLPGQLRLQPGQAQVPGASQPVDLLPPNAIRIQPRTATPARVP